MSTLTPFASHIDNWVTDRPNVMIDKAHAALVYSTIISSKPSSILEIGIGSAFTTISILHAIKYNNKGKLTCVDNWHDCVGVEPPLATELRSKEVDIIVSDEYTFVSSCKNKFDLIMVDGNHNDGHKWADKTLDLMNPGGILFAHDIRSYPNLGVYETLSKERSLSYRIFDQSSLQGERCDRGFIVIYGPSQ